MLYKMDSLKQLKKVDTSMVRWAKLPDDYEVIRKIQAEVRGENITLQQLLDDINYGYVYCCITIDGKPAAMAAVWKISDKVWESARVRVMPEFRGRGYAKAITAFITEYILQNGRTATCRTKEENIPMRSAIKALGFAETSYAILKR